MGLHRYWRLQCLTVATAVPVFGLAELRGHTVIGGANVFILGTALDSSHFDATFLPGNAFDNDINTAWASATPNSGEFIGIDLGVGNSADIIEIQVIGRNSSGVNQAPLTANVQYSDDGITWTTYWPASFAPWTVAGQTQTVSSITDPDLGQVAILGVEQISPSQIDIGQIVILGILEGPPNSIALGPAITLPCWQPCTAFGTEARVIIFK